MSKAVASAENNSPTAARPLFVVFGATGDLMHRKLLPALFGITAQGFHPEAVTVLGVARKAELDDESFRAMSLKSLADRPALNMKTAKEWVNGHLFFQAVPQGTPQEYRVLAERVKGIETELKLSGDRVLYLALPVDAFSSTIDGVVSAGLEKSNQGWTRIVMEKPFGVDLPSAKALNAKVHAHFDESQVFRIDHYLGKETVQNLLVFRFANLLFESVWNRDRIDRVEITVAEDLGVEGRAQYYEESGALRDMVQNHLTQLLTLTAMEAPIRYEAESIRNEKVKVLRSIRALRTEDAVFGQYAAGTSHGTDVPGYRQEPGVASDSTTETFVAVRVEIDTWRWHGVPFILRTGKHLARRVTQILVRFRSPPVSFFRAYLHGQIPPNELLITVQPNEGFDLVFEVKSPGKSVELKTERMHFRYAEAFASLPDDYQTLILDVIQGDPTLFVRADEVEESWRLYDPLIRHPPPLQFYPAGSWGPAAASEWMSHPPDPQPES